jgi:hypothetical protein
MKKQIIAIILFMIFCAFSQAQNRLTWNITKPAIEIGVDSVLLKIIDNNNNEVFKDTIALYGTRDDIPTPAVIVGNPGFNVESYGNGNKTKLKISTTLDQDVRIVLTDMMGRQIVNGQKHIIPGMNEFDFEPGNLATGMYALTVAAKEGIASSKIVSGFDGNNVSKANVSSLKSAEISDWKFIVSHPKLLTDTFSIPYSNNMFLNGSLSSRPYVYLKAIDVFTRKGEYGGLKLLNDMTTVPGLSVAVGNNVYGKTNLNGEFLFRPDTIGNSRIMVIDSLETFYSKWFDFNLVAGQKDTLRDFKSGEVDMIQHYVDTLGKDLLEALWHIHGYENRSASNFAGVTFQDSILNTKGVWIDPKYKDGNHNHSLGDINQQIEKFHVSGLPKLFESDSLNSYIFIHHGGTFGDGETQWTYRQNEEGLYYKTRADIYISTVWTDYGGPAHPIYALTTHEFDRVFYAYWEFPEKFYVMYTDPINRVYRDGYSPENTPLENKILRLVVNGSTHLMIHNNFLLSRELNFPGYNGTKSAKIPSSKTALNLKQMEKIFSGADNVEIENDRDGPIFKATHFHKPRN